MHAGDFWAEFWAKKVNRKYPAYIANEPAQGHAAFKHVRDKDFVEIAEKLALLIAKFRAKRLLQPLLKIYWTHKP